MAHGGSTGYVSNKLKFFILKQVMPQLSNQYMQLAEEMHNEMVNEGFDPLDVDWDAVTENLALVLSSQAEHISDDIEDDLLYIIDEG